MVHEAAMEYPSSRTAYLRYAHISCIHISHRNTNHHLVVVVVVCYHLE
jgi:hypothetical protein